MIKQTVVIFDDEEGLRQEWKDRLLAVPGFPQELKVRVADKDEFEADLRALRRRREAAREEQELSDRQTLFDEARVLIVDYDLFGLGETGEDVAYLARCFSQCGTIVAVNQFAKEGFTFDLTLQGHTESFADLNLLADQLFNPGLWTIPWEGFRPWYWPLLPKAADALEERVEELSGRLGERIMDFLKVPDRVREVFPVGALEFISSKDVPPLEATFRTFVDDSGKALRGRKEKAASDKARARIAAARLAKWLERLVLPGQNVLIDAVHLLERYPSLFKGGPPDRLIDWSNTHELLAPGQAIIDFDGIEQFRFKKSAWLSRTAWYWPLVSEREEISEVSNPWEPRQELAFCEDTSRFVYPSEDLPEFVARVDSPFVRRFVSTRDPRYGPQLQFAL